MISLRRDVGLDRVPDILKLVAKFSHLNDLVVRVVVVVAAAAVVVVTDVTSRQFVGVGVGVVRSFVLGYHGPVSSVGEVLAEVPEFPRQLVHHLLEDHRVHVLTWKMMTSSRLIRDTWIE